MKVLAIDTATAIQSVAVMEGTRVLARADHAVGHAQAKRLIPTIEGVLRSSALGLRDLDGLAVSIGPGSFTGLRVGVATMQAFRSVTGLPLAAVPTLEALAWNVGRCPLLICPILRARAEEVYWALYRRNAREGLVQVGGERIGSPEAVADSIRQPVIALGEGWDEHRGALRRLLESGGIEVVEAPSDAMAPSAVSVGVLGQRVLALGANAPIGVAPRYVQPAEAELMWGHRPGAAGGGPRG